jgi:hypothetical protein
MKKLLATLAFGIAVLPILSGAALARGCHRDVEVDRYGPHRHVGPYCERLDVPPPPPPRHHDREGRDHRDDRDYRRAPPPPICEKKCHYVGPFKTCETVCREGRY